MGKSEYDFKKKGITAESQQTQPTEGLESNLCYTGGRQVLFITGLSLAAPLFRFWSETQHLYGNLYVNFLLATKIFFFLIKL